jgi:hypothetical protein
MTVSSLGVWVGLPVESMRVRDDLVDVPGAPAGRVVAVVAARQRPDSGAGHRSRVRDKYHLGAEGWQSHKTKIATFIDK